MTPDDTELLAWVDDELDAARARAIARAVAADPELAAVTETLRASRLPVREAYERVVSPPVPPALETAVRALVANPAAIRRPGRGDGRGEERHDASRAGSHRPRIDDRPRRADGAHAAHRAAGATRPRLASASRAALVAALVLGVGLVGHELGGRRAPEPAPAALAAVTTDTALWTRRVAEYQSLYVRATVERHRPDPAATGALLEHLADRDGLDPHIPDLAAEGYRFVRAQELGWRDETLVQVVYLAADGPPLALCFMPDTGATIELGIENHAGLATGTWRRGGQRYVLVGDLSADELRSLSRHVDEAFATRG